ncbi:Type III restriction enzyme, res subunit:DEAD/DEAH box helicase, N- terminal [Desulfovibrio sp. DV]|uniref:TOTE conflict system archaeo-eukaryotic primase domain-containing protein n=1 Tax=Desulfovibrio sp. DV TaxID=1844708 RepID=UPI00095A1955|nr:DUF927 domain-containing protein [Desulfovibrio sp. DV]OLN27143.1 Type III restriction enzyme, res subunit:DEAD/DEAH box helicase, N- terminal [Desulfovibrio sp. DV]
MAHDSNDLISLYRSLFRGREDVFAEYFEYIKSSGEVDRGYRPVLIQNSKEYQPLTDELLQKHFRGETILGLYPLLENSCCYFIAADFDNHTGNESPYDDMLLYVNGLKELGIEAYVLKSRSGDGYHVYFFFKEQVHAKKGRDIANHVLKQAGLLIGTSHQRSFDKLFPAQNDITGLKIGNLIALPYQKEAAEKRSTRFLSPEKAYKDIFDTTEEELQFMASIIKYDDSYLTGILEKIQPATEPSKFVLPEIIPSGSRHNTMISYCASLHAKNYSDEEIFAKINEANSTRFNPPIDEKELLGIYEHIIKKPKGSSSLTPLANFSKKSPKNFFTDSNYVKIKSMLPDAPVSELAELPSNFYLTTKGIFMSMTPDGARELIFDCPVVIKSRAKVCDSKFERILLAWFIDGEWKEHLFDRVSLFESLKVVEITNLGIPINSLNKKQFIFYLSIYESANRENIPISYTTNKLGWHEENTYFVWGRYLITKDGILNSQQLQGLGIKQITYKGEGEGDDQFLDGLDSKGTVDEWYKMAIEVKDFPIAYSILMASFAAPLLKILGMPNLIVETAGETSKGKSTCQRLAVSVWGCPNEKEICSIYFTWDSTPVWLERRASTFNDIPVVLDDTKRLFSKYTRDEANKIISNIIYSFASGKGRGRGGKIGTVETTTYQSVLISSGEQQSIDAAKGHGGASARVISFWGSPLGDEPKEQLVRNINETACNNYGFAGPLFVYHILTKQNFWDEWKVAYNKINLEYSLSEKGSGVIDRISEYFAALESTAWLVSSCFAGLEPTAGITATFRKLFAEYIGEVKEHTDIHLKALKEIISWIGSNQQKFYGKHRTDGGSNAIEPSGGWLGRWQTTDDYIAIVSHQLNERLTKLNYDAEPTIKSWKSKGILIPSARQNTKTVHVGKARTACYCLSVLVIKDLIGIDLSIESDSGVSN